METKPTDSAATTIDAKTEADMLMAKRKMKKMLCWLAVAIVVIILGILIYTGVVLYKQKSRNAFTDQMTQWLPYPAAIVDGDWLLYRDVRTSVNDAIKVTAQFAQDQDLVSNLGAIPTNEEVAESEYDRLVNVALLEQVASDHDVTATDDEVDDMYESAILTQVNGDEAQVEKTLQDLYGWSVADFKRLVVRELVLRQKLQTELVDDESYGTPALQKIKDIQAQVQADPSKFADLATQYSDDGSAANGGDLDWFARGVMVPEFEDAAFALTEPNQVSDVVKTQFGYHLIQLIERKDATDTEEEQVHARHILIKFSIDDYITTLDTDAHVKRLIDPKTLAN